MPSLASSIFYIAFIAQILLTSVYFANRVVKRMRYVFETYPPDQYPKLYPKPDEHYQRVRWKFQLANQIIAGVGLAILALIMFVIDHSTFADDGYISEAFPAVFGLLQFVPFMALEISEYSQLKLLRSADGGAVRRAGLERRGLFDLVSPLLIASALACLVLTIMLDVYVHDGIFSLSHDTGQRAMTLVITNLLLALVGAFTLYGGKKDPHLTGADYRHKLGANLRSLAFVSIALSLFTALRALGDAVDIGAYEATLLSLYFQGIVILSLGYILNSIRVEDVNFDVYRDDVAMGQP